MKPILTLTNVPPNLSDAMLETVLCYNEIQWRGFVIDPTHTNAEEKTVHILLQSGKTMSTALRILNQCEISLNELQAKRAEEAVEKLFPSKPVGVKKSIDVKTSNEVKKSKHHDSAQDDELMKNRICMDDLTPEAQMFSNMGLHETLLNNVLNLGYEKAMPIQALSIKPVLDGRDVIGKAQTGTGKTLAFSLPMINRLMEIGGGRGLQGLILTPTRELAIQIHAVIEPLLAGTDLSAVVVYGGDSIHDQILKLKDGADIIVATPGRLLDLQERRRIRIDAAEMLVLDEADRMLDLGFQPQLQKILRAFYMHPQTLMYSATISNTLRKLMTSMLQDPVYVEAGNPNMVPLDAITQESMYLHDDEKMARLHHLLKDEEGPTIIFANMRRSVERLYQKLKLEGYKVLRIHGDISQPDRNRAVEAFKRGDYKILVATDVAARGLDIEGVAHVINYDLSETPEDHIHRIGRTARAGATGKATTFLPHKDKKNMKQYKSVLGMKR